MEKLEKTCKKHGVLEEKDIQPQKGKSPRCKICVAECEKRRGYKRKWYEGRTCSKHGVLKQEDVYENGGCKACVRARANKFRRNNKELINEKNREYAKNHPEKWYTMQRERGKRFRDKIGSEELTTRSIIRTHGLTRERYDQMFLEQDHKCKICKNPETRKSPRPGQIARLVVDHCHITGQVRALLCHQCNLMLGAVQDNPVILQSAISYLEAHKE